MRIGTAWIAINLGLAASACDGSSGPATVLCSTPVEVSVTTAATPRFTWAPQCLVQQVVVLEPIAPSVGGSPERWALQKLSGIASPLAYGQVPVGAELLLPAEALVPGHHYVVQLGMMEVVGSSNIVAEGAFSR